MNLFSDNDEKHRTSEISSSRMALIPQELFPLQVGRRKDGGLVFLGKTRVTKKCGETHRVCVSMGMDLNLFYPIPCCGPTVG